MLNFKKIEKLAQGLHESVPKIVQNFTYDLDSKIHKILHNQINRMHFINRQEFDLQTKTLFQTQKKLEKLEKKLNILEAKYKNKCNKYKNQKCKQSTNYK